jgi:HSP20 family protein
MAYITGNAIKLNEEGVMAQKKIRPLAIRHWEPIRRVENAERHFLGDLDRFLEGNFPSLKSIWSKIPGEEHPWAPAAEMYETDDRFVVRVELPGVNPDDLDISVMGDYLVVKGQRKPTEDIASERYHECELCYGQFYRRFSLPPETEPGKTEATYENGILELNIPKVKAAKPTKIKIKTT